MDRQITSHKPGALALYNKAKIKKEPMQKIDTVKDTTITNYTSFISEEIHKATVTDWNSVDLSGENLLYPSAAQLATDVKSFGNISRDHSFTKEATFENIAIFILKSPFLDLASLLAIVKASVLLSILWK